MQGTAALVPFQQSGKCELLLEGCFALQVNFFNEILNRIQDGKL